MSSRSLAWAYPYAEKPTTPPATVGGPVFGGAARPGWIRRVDGSMVQAPLPTTHWQVTAPVVQDGKTVSLSEGIRPAQTRQTAANTSVFGC